MMAMMVIDRRKNKQEKKQIFVLVCFFKLYLLAVLKNKYFNETAKSVAMVVAVATL